MFLAEETKIFIALKKNFANYPKENEVILSLSLVDEIRKSM